MDFFILAWCLDRVANTKEISSLDCRWQLDPDEGHKNRSRLHFQMKDLHHQGRYRSLDWAEPNTVYSSQPLKKSQKRGKSSLISENCAKMYTFCLKTLVEILVLILKWLIESSPKFLLYYWTFQDLKKLYSDEKSQMNPFSNGIPYFRE